MPKKTPLKRAPFVMKGFSYPGGSPLHDEKQSTMSGQGTAGGWESKPWQDARRPSGEGRGNRWKNVLSTISQSADISKYLGGTGWGGTGGIMGAGLLAPTIAGLIGGKSRHPQGYRRAQSTRGSRGYELGTPTQGYVSQHPTFMTS